mgnify:CR=1 FL=1
MHIADLPLEIIDAILIQLTLFPLCDDNVFNAMQTCKLFLHRLLFMLRRRQATNDMVFASRYMLCVILNSEPKCMTHKMYMSCYTCGYNVVREYNNSGNNMLKLKPTSEFRLKINKIVQIIAPHVTLCTIAENAFWSYAQRALRIREHLY